MGVGDCRFYTARGRSSAHFLFLTLCSWERWIAGSGLEDVEYLGRIYYGQDIVLKTSPPRCTGGKLCPFFIFEEAAIHGAIDPFGKIIFNITINLEGGKSFNFSFWQLCSAFMRCYFSTYLTNLIFMFVIFCC